MKKVICVLLCVLFVSVFACAEEATPAEAITGLYEQIEMSAVKEDLEAKFTLTETEDGYFLLEDEVLLAFYESGRLQAKTRRFENAADVAPAADIPLDAISKYKQGMTIEEVTEAFGAEGLEIMRINLADEEDAGLRRVLVWKTDENVVVQALFELDDNEWVLFAIAEVK